MKTVFLVIVGLLFIIVIGSGLDLLGVEWLGFIGPKRENVRREIFEETKSYTHGKIQDLAKYFDEYKNAESEEDKQTIQTIIKSQFAEVDAHKIKPDALRQFLIQMRGY